MNASRCLPAFKPVLLASVLAAVLAACGGGGGDSSTPVVPVPPPQSDLLPPTTGPGDTLNYVPTGGMDSWTYNAFASDGAQTEVDLATLSIAGTKTVLGQPVTVFAERLFSDPAWAPAYERYYQKGPGGVAFYGNNDPTDTLTAGVVPYAELLFPVAAGPIISFTKTGLDLGADLDSDGKNETVDATQTISIAGFESITTPAGTFPAAAKRLSTIVATTRLTSSGQAVTVNTTETSWLAPGAGLVRVDTVATAPGTTVNLTGSLEARGYTVSGVRKGLGNPEEVMYASGGGVLTQTDFGEPPDPVDTPAVASSGSTFLVITKSFTADPLTSKWLLRRKGFLRSPDGPVINNATFDIGAPVLSNDTREIQSLAYGSGTYLAVFEQRNPVAPNVVGPTEPSIVAQRIAPDGVVTDAVPIVIVPQGNAPAMPGVSSRLPQVAYGGGVFLVVYSGGDGTTSTTFTAGVLVDPGGGQSAPFHISPDFTYAGVSPRVVFDGTNFIVATGDATGWRLARVTPGGAVLDPSGVDALIPGGRMQMTSSGAGGVLATWITFDEPFAKRYAADLTPLDASVIPIAMASSARYAVTAGFVGGEYVVAWTQRYTANMTTQQLVLYMNRIALDGKVQGQSPPLNALPSTRPYAALLSPIPPMPSSGYTGGYALPVLATGTNAALIAYVTGTANGFTPAERASGVQAIWAHPFAR